MSEMEEKIGAILNNPQLMQQIMSMAQAMGAQQTRNEEPSKEQSAPAPPSIPEPDPRMLQKFAGMMQQGNTDRNQQALLKALGPYLSRNRVSKLERAMRAAKMAGVASAFLNAGGLQMNGGR